MRKLLSQNTQLMNLTDETIMESRVLLSEYTAQGEDGANLLWKLTRQLFLILI